MRVLHEFDLRSDYQTDLVPVANCFEPPELSETDFYLEKQSHHKDPILTH